MSVREMHVTHVLAHCFQSPRAKDICFVSGGRFQDFLVRCLAEKKKKKKKKTEGYFGSKRRDSYRANTTGFSNFTVGQRKGFGFGEDIEQPLYVIEIRSGTLNRVVCWISKDELEREKLCCKGN